MSSSPMHLGERQALRAVLMERALEDAHQRALAANRSLKCGSPPGLYEGWKHATDHDGCKSDGSTCLCECHDPAVSNDD